jgi:hypothetical protein
MANKNTELFSYTFIIIIVTIQVGIFFTQRAQNFSQRNAKKV